MIISEAGEDWYRQQFICKSRSSDLRFKLDTQFEYQEQVLKEIVKVSRTCSVLQNGRKNDWIIDKRAFTWLKRRCCFVDQCRLRTIIAKKLYFKCNYTLPEDYKSFAHPLQKYENMIQRQSWIPPNLIYFKIRRCMSEYLWIANTFRAPGVVLYKEWIVHMLKMFYVFLTISGNHDNEWKRPSNFDPNFERIA